MVTGGDQPILIELKRGDSASLRERGIAQLSDYLGAANAKYGILFLYSDKSTEYGVTIVEGTRPGNEIHVIRSLQTSNIT
jgi:hypothetical protein